MSNLFEFRPRRTLDDEARVREFIDLVNQKFTNVLVPDTKYFDNSWDVSTTFVIKGVKGRLRLHFVSSDAKVEKGIIRNDPFETPFLDFAKACIRYRHAAAPVSYSATNRRVFGLRCVEAAFRDLGRRPEIWNLDSLILNRAVEIGTTGKAPTTAYKIGSEIETLYKFCIDMRLILPGFAWNHSISYTGKAQMKDGEEINHRYADKISTELSRRFAGELPNTDQLHALGKMLRASPSWAERVYACIATLLIAFPIRAHELLQLRVNPEIGVTEAGEDGEHKTNVGLQIWPGNGDPVQVRWVSKPEYVAIAKHAVKTLRETLAPARDLARWYEDNPGRLFLSLGLEHFREAEWLVVSEVAEILGFSRKTTHQWIDDNGIAKRIGERRETKGSGHGKHLIVVRFSDIERAVLALLPNDFPYVNGDRSGHRYSEALLVAPLNALHTSRSPWKCMFEAVSYGQFYGWLRGRTKVIPPEV